MKEVLVTKKGTGIVIGERIAIADTSLSRLVGLMGRPRLPEGGGLLITPSSGVHTFGMRFPIDVIALDRDMQVVDVWSRLRPFRTTRISLKYHRVLELPAGQIERCGVSVGDQLEVAG